MLLRARPRLLRPSPKVTEKKGDTGAGEPTDSAAKPKRVRKPKDKTNG